MTGLAPGLLTLVFLLKGVARALTRTDVGPVDPARQVRRLAGGAAGLVVPLVLTASMVLAVRARRSWPSRVVVVLAWVGGLLVAGALVLVVRWSSRTGFDVSGVLTAILLPVPLVMALALPVSAAVLLQRPSARAWCDDLRREPRRRPCGRHAGCRRRMPARRRGRAPGVKFGCALTVQGATKP